MSTRVETGNSKRAPLLRWAGSKQRLVPKLADYWGSGYSRYVEPFAGSAALFFHLDPQAACLNDINTQLIECYERLAEDPDDLHQRVVSISSDEQAYYQVRAMNPADLSVEDRAARFIYLNRHCFNGIYRTNQKGDFNVPYGAAGAGGVPSLQRFQECSRTIKRARLSSQDFDEFIRGTVCAGDFVYLDPPYAVANRRIFRQYDKHSFGLDDVERLANCLDFIDSVGASFLVSYADSAEIKPLLSRWVSRRISTQRNVAGFAEHRRKAVEVLITNIEG